MCDSVSYTICQNCQNPNWDHPNSNHIILKRALIKHFQYAYTNGNIHWPKQFSKTQKKKMPLLQVIPFLLFIYKRLHGNRFFFFKQVAVNRAETLMRARLVIRPSELRLD